jgi:F-type H+-transporting ATPase subunit b
MLINQAQAAAETAAQATAEAGHALANEAVHHVPFYQDTTFFVAIAFVLFFVLFGKKLFAAMASSLDDRAEKIKDQIEEATRLREEAQELLASYEKKQHEALKEAANIVKAAKDEAERLSVEAAEQLDASLKRAERLAKDRIAQAEVQAIAEVRTLAINIAMEATQRVLEQDVSATKADALIDTAIKNMEGKLH